VVAVTHRTGTDLPYLAGQPADSVLIDLDPLPATAVTSLITNVLGAVPDSDLSSLAEAAAGNPGAVVELVEGLCDHGLVRIRGGRAGLTRTELPPATRRRIRRQLEEVSGRTRHVVQVGAALGRSFPLSDLAEQFRDTAANLLPAVEQALHNGLFRATPEGLSFSHELVREEIAATLPAVVREALGGPPERRDAPAAAGPASDGWDSLSDIEKDIAQYVRHGLSNREIAPRVFLSPHTVNYHLRQMYRKLGINSRAPLGGIAARHETDAGRR
jgi:DNA-binding NarL/FixJ family response regulator